MANIIPPIPYDTRGVAFIVGLAPMPKKGEKGAQALEHNTGRPLWTTQVAAMTPTTGIVPMEIVIAGEMPDLEPGMYVTPSDLTVRPYLSGGYTRGNGQTVPIEIGMAYKATSLKRADSAAPRKQASASS